MATKKTKRRTNAPKVLQRERRSSSASIDEMLDRWRRVIEWRNELQELATDPADTDSRVELDRLDAALLSYQQVERGTRAIDALFREQRTERIQLFQDEVVDRLLDRLQQEVLSDLGGTISIKREDGSFVLDETTIPLHVRTVSQRVRVAIYLTGWGRIMCDVRGLGIDIAHLEHLLQHETVTIDGVTADPLTHLKTKGKAKARAAILAIIHGLDPRSIEKYQGKQNEVEKKRAFMEDFFKHLRDNDPTSNESTDGRRSNPPLASPNGS